MNLEGKVVIITGATGAIGQAAARAFDREGARLVLASRRIEVLHELAGGLKEAFVLPVDMGDEGQARDLVRKALEKFGRVDILIHNAAAIIIDRSESVTRDDLMQAFRVNLTGPVAATQEALLQMKKQGGGQIINIGSPGFMMGIPFYAPYACSKAAFSAWTRTLQAELGDARISVSEYFPGYIKTDSRAESRLGTVEQDFLMAKKQNFLSKWFTAPKTPEKVAKDLVRLAGKPRPLAYSGSLVKLGAFLSNIPFFRLKIARQMARNAELKLQNQPPGSL